VLPLAVRRDRVLAKATVLVGEDMTRQIWAQIENLEIGDDLSGFISAL